MPVFAVPRAFEQKVQAQEQNKLSAITKLDPGGKPSGLLNNATKRRQQKNNKLLKNNKKKEQII